MIFLPMSKILKEGDFIKELMIDKVSKNNVVSLKILHVNMNIIQGIIIKIKKNRG